MCLRVIMVLKRAPWTSPISKYTVVRFFMKLFRTVSHSVSFWLYHKGWILSRRPKCQIVRELSNSNGTDDLELRKKVIRGHLDDVFHFACHVRHATQKQNSVHNSKYASSIYIAHVMMLSATIFRCFAAQKRLIIFGFHLVVIMRYAYSLCRILWYLLHLPTGMTRLSWSGWPFQTEIFYLPTEGHPSLYWPCPM